MNLPIIALTVVNVLLASLLRWCRHMYVMPARTAVILQYVVIVLAVLSGLAWWAVPDAAERDTDLVSLFYIALYEYGVSLATLCIVIVLVWHLRMSRRNDTSVRFAVNYKVVMSVLAFLVMCVFPGIALLAAWQSVLAVRR